MSARKDSGKQRSSGVVGALARIEARRVDDKVRLELAGASADAIVLLQQFVGALNGRTFDPSAPLATRAFDRPIRLESVGIGDDGEVDSVAFEASVAAVIHHVDSEHERRAAAFCQRHRHTTTTEALDDLAAEFERVAREAARVARAEAFKELIEWGSSRAAETRKGP
jgi:hypothetical protein